MKNDQALLILDMQNDFCHAEGRMHDLVSAELQRHDVVDSALRLVRAALDKGVPTIVTPIEFDYDAMGTAQPEGIVAPIVERRAFARGEFGARLIDELEALARDGEVLRMPKPALSAFTGTSLHEELQSRGVEEVVIAGLLTNFCVENTARDAFDLGYRVRVVSDATATFDSDQKAYAMETIFPQLGRVVTIDEFRNEPAGSAH